MRLCAAIRSSFSESLVLPVSMVSCPGALRSLAVTTRDEGLVSQICENTHLPLHTVNGAVRATPQLSDPVISVTLGRNLHFDVAVAYVRPDVVMNLVRKWQAICGAPLESDMSTFMAICGNAVVAAHETGRIRLSAGCPTSRAEGVLRDNELVVAIPTRMLEILFPANGSGGSHR
jgi:uncharacterized protein (DUF169 family)